MYVLKSNDPYCHICGELHANNAHFNFTQYGCIFKMMGGTCGENKFPVVGRIHLPPDIREMLGGDVQHARKMDLLNGDVGLSKAYAQLWGSELKFINAKGEGFMWDVDKRLWLEVEPVFVRQTVALRLLSEVGYYIRQVNLEIADFEKDNPQPYDAETALELHAIRDKKKEMCSVQHSLQMARTTKGILEYLVPKLADYKFATQVNRSAHELPVKDGLVLNLKTLETKARRISDHFSFELPVAYNASDCRPQALKFFQGICNGDEELLSFLQRLLGYTLTGEVSVRSLFVLWGDGCNGKSTLINLTKRILGRFYTAISEDVLIQRVRRSGATPELIPLVSAGPAVFSESEDESKLHSTRIKNLTGADDISARDLYAKQVTFRPQAKLFMMTNHLPKFDFRDRAMVDRLKLIPFTARFEPTPENNQFVQELETDHLDEVFSWLAEGSRQFYEGGIGDIPKCCTAQMQDYIEANDNVARFMTAFFKLCSKTLSS